MINSQTALKVIDILTEQGFKAYAVGGAVRDAYLKRKVSDVDVTTSALPEEVIRAFNGYNVIPTGLKHGTVTVIINGEPVEITTFRTESGYNDNRHPDSVEFVKDVESDLMRRDFTVNAMAWNKKEGLIDPYGGKKDADSKIIRAVGNAEERFKEDALRILRALRFSATLGFTIEKETAKAINKCAVLLKNVSSERIYSELTKLIVGNRVEEVLLKFRKVIFEIIPELKRCDGFDQRSKYHAYDVYTHIVKSVAYSERDKTVRLACLLHDVAKPECFTVDMFGRGHFYTHQEKSAEISVKVLKRLKADNKTVNTVETLIRLHDEFIESDKPSVKRFLNEYGYEIMSLLTKVRVGDALAHSCFYGKERAERAELIQSIADIVVKNNECYNLKMLAVNGNDVSECGYKGEEIKTVLNKLLYAVFDGKYVNEKNILLKAIKK